MNHRIIQLGADQAILLDRIENDDDKGAPWQVIISTFVDIDYRFDEWVTFDDPAVAQSFIVDFSERSAIRFMERANLYKKGLGLNEKQPTIK